MTLPAAHPPCRIDVTPLVPLLDEPVVVVDAGCRWGATSSWSSLGSALRVLAFDADADECARLTAAQSDDDPVRYVPTALGAHNGVATLHVAREPACSSIFPPDPVALRERPLLELIATVSTATVPLARLDDWAAEAGISAVHAMKLDVQGAELEILRGAPTLLGGVRVVEIEVTFTPIYTGQALFGDVDAYLRRHGFELWRLNHLVHYGRAGHRDLTLDTTPTFYDERMVTSPTHGGQLYWGHAHYVARDLAHRDPLPWPVRVRDAAICAAAGFTDLADGCLADAAEAGPPKRVAEAIRAARAPMPSLRTPVAD